MDSSEEEPSSGTERVRVVVADDDADVLNEIVRILEPRFEVVGRAADGQELLEAVQNLSPSVVVTDINMPKMNGLESTRLITRDYPDVKVIMVSVYNDPAILEAVFKAGALGYVSKLYASIQLIPAIEHVLSGRLYRPGPDWVS